MNKEKYAHEALDDQIHEMMDAAVQPKEIDRSRQIHKIEDTGASVEAYTTTNAPEIEAMQERTKIGRISTSDGSNHS
ncbi:hypothetical protein PMIN01_01982 [Paraphaeosphaeria minitans]|uniref:Uncharacterized protein n=1 Tax=Paraphaeosphaeria minitans TaxID=565426 RepID=A0A9P6GQG7_9PLEO|nr:hypothetical protein PMIN01_01982 [Paraphaeosphaeria minitans]